MKQILTQPFFVIAIGAITPNIQRGLVKREIAALHCVPLAIRQWRTETFLRKKKIKQKTKKHASLRDNP